MKLTFIVLAIILAVALLVFLVTLKIIRNKDKINRKARFAIIDDFDTSKSPESFEELNDQINKLKKALDADEPRKIAINKSAKKYKYINVTASAVMAIEVLHIIIFYIITLIH